MTRAEFVKQVAKDADLSNHDAKVAVEVVFETLKQALLRGEEVPIYRFCTFKPKTRAGRKGHSPLTGESIWIEPKKTIRVSFSSLFKSALNNETQDI